MSGTKVKSKAWYAAKYETGSKWKLASEQDNKRGRKQDRYQSQEWDRKEVTQKVR